MTTQPGPLIELVLRNPPPDCFWCWRPVRLIAIQAIERRLRERPNHRDLDLRIECIHADWLTIHAKKASSPIQVAIRAKNIARSIHNPPDVSGAGLHVTHPRRSTLMCCCTLRGRTASTSILHDLSRDAQAPPLCARHDRARLPQRPCKLHDGGKEDAINTFKHNLRCRVHIRLRLLGR